MKTLKQFEVYLKEEKFFAPQTIASVTGDSKQFSDWLKHNYPSIRIKRVTYEMCLRFIEELQQKNVKPQTLNGYINSLKHLYNFLEVKKNPFQNLKIRGAKRGLILNMLSEEEMVEMYVNYPKDTPLELRNKVLLGLYIFQGLSVYEPEELKVNDVDFLRGKISIPKNSKRNQRVLNLSPYQIVEMKEYVDKTRGEIKQKINSKNVVDDELFFSYVGGKQLVNVRVNISGELNKTKRKIENFHQIRKSVIVNWLKKEDVRIVTYKSGHRYVSSTEKYKLNNLVELHKNILKKHPLG